MNYQEFLDKKRIIVQPSEFDIDESTLNPMLWNYQWDIVKFALKAGMTKKVLEHALRERNTMTLFDYASM